MNDATPWTEHDEFASEWTKVQFLKNRKNVILGRIGIIKRKYLKSENTAHHKSKRISTCQKCNQEKPLTKNYYGDEMCSDCFLNSL